MLGDFIMVFYSFSLFVVLAEEGNGLQGSLKYSIRLHFPSPQNQAGYSFPLLQTKGLPQSEALLHSISFSITVKIKALLCLLSPFTTETSYFPGTTRLVIIKQGNLLKKQAGVKDEGT